MIIKLLVKYSQKKHFGPHLFDSLTYVCICRMQAVYAGLVAVWSTRPQLLREQTANPT